MIKPHIIEARGIPEAWWQCLHDVVIMAEGKTREWTIDKGSFEGRKRLDFTAPIVVITHPCEKSLFERIPRHAEGSPLPNPIDAVIYPLVNCEKHGEQIKAFIIRQKGYYLANCGCIVDQSFYEKHKPSDESYVLKYFSEYLFSDRLKEDETYTYGSRILEPIEIDAKKVTTLDDDLVGNILVKELPVSGWERKRFIYLPQYYFVVDMLRKTPMTNQAVLQIEKQSDLTLDDPPCLRLIDCRIIDGKLNFYIYFRSWDLYNGFPANLCGLSLLMEQMACDVGVETGSFVCMSKSLHIYDHHFELVKQQMGIKG